MSPKAPDVKLLHAATSAEWRAWLASHHDAETEIWLVFHKKHTGQPRVAYEDAVQEALCFGWIDSLVRRLDDDRYAQKFTPRRARSKWSAHNLRRFAQLVAEGRMTAAGLAKGPPREMAAARPPRPRRAEPVVVPADVEAALRADAAAWVQFAKLAPSYRRLYVGWIEAAKRPETRARRLAEAVTLLAQGKKLGLK